MVPLRVSLLRAVHLFVLSVVVSSTGIAGTFEVETRRDIGVIKRKIRAAQFLHRATFGPTIEMIDELAERMGQIGTRRAMDEWIDRQFELPVSLHQPLALRMIADDGLDPTTNDNVWIQRFRHHAWWHNALTGEDQLRQRVAWALVQILVTSADGEGFNDTAPGNISGIARWLGPTNYYDMLLRNAFGNYREILHDVTYHPVMGVYLSHVRNRKASGSRFPDENYAREIMQLFSIGLYEMHWDGRLKTDENGELIPTYDNDTIKEFARVFTGLTFRPPDPDDSIWFWTGNEFQYPMEMYQQEHDTDPKTLLGGEVIDIDDGNADIAAALDNVFNHYNVGPFIARRLIQRFVKSNPSRAYIRRVTRKFNNNGAGVRGDMKAVIKAVLLDPEVWRGTRVRARVNPFQVEVLTRGTDHSRLREPVIRYTSLLRAVHCRSTYHTGRMMVLPQNWSWTQEPYTSPSVFNFWVPDFQPPGDLITYTPSRRIPNGAIFSPEFQQKTAVTSNRLAGRYLWDISSQNSQQHWTSPEHEMKCDLRFDLSEEKLLATEDDDMHDLLDRLDLLYCCGSMPQDYKDRVVAVINQETQWMKTNSQWRAQLEDFRVESALIAVVMSPFCAVAD